MTKIRNMSTLALILILLFLIYYPYKALEWQLNMAFLDPERWLGGIWCGNRPLYTGGIFLGLVSYFVGRSTCIAGGRSHRLGVIFDDRIASAIMWLGRFTVASSGIHILAACVSPMIVSWHNPSGSLPLRFWYSSPHLSLIFCGLAFLLMGAVMREAIKVALDNEGFV